MTTVINNPGNGESGDSGAGMIVGVVILIVIVALFFMYVLPAIRNNEADPQGGSIDVNVNLPKDVTPPTQ